MGAPAYGAVADRLDAGTVLVWSLALAATGFAAIATFPPVPVLAGIAGVAGLAVGPVNPVLAGLMQSRSDEGMRGRVVSTTWSLSLVAAPLGMLVAGLLLDASGPPVTMLVVAVGVLAAATYAALAPGLRPTAGAQKARPSRCEKTSA